MALDTAAGPFQNAARTMAPANTTWDAMKTARSPYVRLGGGASAFVRDPRSERVRINGGLRSCCENKFGSGPIPTTQHHHRGAISSELNNSIEPRGKRHQREKFGSCCHVFTLQRKKTFSGRRRRRKSKEQRMTTLNAILLFAIMPLFKALIRFAVGV